MRAGFTRQRVTPEGRATERTPRTLFITNDFPPRIGGAQSYYWGVIQTLDPADVVILAPSHRGAAVFDATHGYTVERAPTTILWPTQGLFRHALALCERHGVELVQLGHPLPAGLLGPRLKAAAGLPYAVFLGGAEVTLPAVVPGVRRALCHVLGGASMLIAVSEYTAGLPGRVPGVPARVLRPPLDVDALHGADPAAARGGPFGPRHRRPARSLRRPAGPTQGPGQARGALPTLAARFPDLELALVGEGRLATRLFERRSARAWLTGYG